MNDYRQPITIAGDGSLELVEVTRDPKVIDVPHGREVQLRNVGMNTLWISMDGKVYFDVACGTSFDVRQKYKQIWLRTRYGKTFTHLLATN